MSKTDGKNEKDTARIKIAVVITGFLVCAACSFILGFYISNNSEMKKSGVYTVSVERAVREEAVYKHKAEAGENENYSELMVNINTADLEELKSLNGIGEKLAGRIIAYREENGGFDYTYEIMNVSGIGDGLYDKIKNNIYV